MKKQILTLDEFINESFFKNLSVGERARIEAQLKEWESLYIGKTTKKVLSPGSWTVNKDHTVDVDGDVWLFNSEFEYFPVKFNKVSGWFVCKNSKNLKSLEGCPKYVKQQFNAIGCINLTSLEGSPIEVGESFDVRGCINLNSLKGIPKKVNDIFFISGAKIKFTENEIRKKCKVGGSVYI